MQSDAFYFSDGPYRQTLQGLYAALSESETFIKLLGKPRTGKSRVCEKLVRFMQRQDYQVVYFDYAIESPDMLRAMLARELDLPNSTNFARLLEDALRERADKPLILIFDDAHLLTDITLMEIYRLAEVQVGTKRMLNIVLCGEPELEKRLLSNREFRMLLLSVSHRFLLEPMDANTLGQFIAAYFEKAGLPGLLLEPAAMNYFFKCCRGFPGLASSLCRRVVEARKGQVELQGVSKKELALIVSDAASDEHLPNSFYRDNNQLMILGPVVAVLMVASIGFLYQQLNQSQLSGESAPQPAAFEETSAAVTSPFADDENRLEAVREEQRPPALPVAQVREQPAPVAVPVEEPVVEPDAVAQVGAQITAALEPAAPAAPVSDSGLLLVTAAERGVLAEEITVPEYEVVLPDGADDGELVADARADDPGQDAPVAGDEPAQPAALLVQQRVQRWMAAWQEQSLDEYFSHYHPEFRPRYQDDQDAWRRNRRRVIGNADWIRLELNDYRLIEQTAEQIEVHFWLTYDSPTYRDETLKKLVLGREQGQWLILEEINLEVRS